MVRISKIFAISFLSISYSVGFLKNIKVVKKKNTMQKNNWHLKNSENIWIQNEVFKDIWNMGQGLFQ